MDHGVPPVTASTQTSKAMSGPPHLSNGSVQLMLSQANEKRTVTYDLFNSVEFTNGLVETRIKETRTDSASSSLEGTNSNDQKVKYGQDRLLIHTLEWYDDGTIGTRRVAPVGSLWSLPVCLGTRGSRGGDSRCENLLRLRGWHRLARFGAYRCALAQEVHGEETLGARTSSGCAAPVESKATQPGPPCGQHATREIDS